MKKQSFGKTSDGQPVDLYTLTNKKGMEVAITNFGGMIVYLKAPRSSRQVRRRGARL